ncbi:HIT family protein [Desulfobacterota bacterium M19]
MSYILGQAGTHQGCIFDFPAAVSHDQKGLLLYRDELCEVLMNRFPYANGHLLIAPARHVADITELNTAEANALMAMLKDSIIILRRHLRPDGFNSGLNLGATAGAGQADHLHFHVVPRWKEDHNFMTVTADIRSIPEHIDNTFKQLLPDFQALTAAKRKTGADGQEKERLGLTPGHK